MKSDQAEGRLRELLVAAGVKAAAPPRRLRRSPAPTREDPARAWAVWRQFASEPADDVDDRPDGGNGILAQWGVYDWGHGEFFEVDLTRQFEILPEGQTFGYLTQVSCTFRYVPTPALRALGADNLWSFGRALDDFFADVLALPAFRLDAAPDHLAVASSDV